MLYIIHTYYEIEFITTKWKSLSRSLIFNTLLLQYKIQYIYIIHITHDDNNDKVLFIM